MRTSRAIAALLCCIAPLSAARAPKKVPAKVAKDSKTKVNPVIQKWMRSLTLRDKVAQLVVMPCYGEAINTRSAQYRKYVHEVRDLKIGGLIVMGHVQGGAVHNAEPFAMTAFLNRMQRLAKVPLLVSSDFERGASMRVNSTTAWPHNMAFAAARDLDDTRFEGAFTAKEARALGVNWVFAPDADVNNNPDNPVINTRSYGENPVEVAEHVKAYIEGAHSDPKNMVLVTAKHFPGHGDTAEDSHLGLARLDVDKVRINTVELAPFRAAIAAGVDSVMTAHMAVPALEPESIPATVSSNILTALLRKDLNFQGLTVTDAMDMRGLSQLFPVGEASVRAMEAGADVLLMPLNADEAIKAVVAAVDSGRLTKQRIDESVLRVLTAKAQVGLPNRRFVDVEGVGDVIQSPEADERAQNVADKAVTLVRNEGKILPLADPDKSCVVILTENRNRQQGTHIMDEIRRRNTKTNVVLLDPAMSKADLDAAQGAPGCGAIVIVAYANVSSYRGSVALPGEFTGFVNALLSGTAPVAMISLGNPYLVRSFPNVKTYVATFSTAATSETAAVKAMFGEIPISGHLPVTIPGIAKYGDGIQSPATRQALPPVPTARIQTKHPNRKGS
jgi:beta-N-acetylhexosaminidase